MKLKQNLRTCDGCGKRHQPDELNTVDTTRYGEHWTLEICDQCKGNTDSPAVVTNPSDRETNV